MARIIVLDSIPLGLACRRRGHVGGDLCRGWLDALRLAGALLVDPEIADFEVRRELIRAGSRTGLTRLDNLTTNLAYDPITTPIMHRAAEFWADVRRRGLPTASDQSLDADAILAAQADLIGNPGDAVTVATSNPGHFTRFPGIDAQDWPTITP
jgi:predicted nucleic acid-binding protein